MRRLLACIVLVMAFAGCGAAASSVSGADAADQPYENAAFGYRLSYPAGWILLDQNTVEAYLAQLSGEGVSPQGLSPGVLEAAQSLLRKSPEDSCVIFMAPGGHSVAVVCSDFPTPSGLDTVLDVLPPLVIAMYGTMYPDYTVVDGGSVYTVGDVDFVKLKFESKDGGRTNLQTGIYNFDHGKMYSFTATWVNAEPAESLRLDGIFEAMLSSFAPEP